MTARSVGTATVAFGLVSIPVKLFTTIAKSDDGIKFAQLHDRDHGRLKQVYTCTTCEKPVGPEDTVRGYEHAKGQYVTLSAEEMKAIDAIATQTIALEEYLPEDAIDPIYIEKSFYLGPDKGAERSFRLLWSALVEAGRVGIGSYSANRRQTVVAVKPYCDLLLLQQLRYTYEVIHWSDVPLPKFEDPPAEVRAIAKQMIEQYSTENFNVARYRDEVQERMLELVEKKVEGGTIEPPPPAAKGKVISITEALRASLKPKP